MRPGESKKNFATGRLEEIEELGEVIGVTINPLNENHSLRGMGDNSFKIYEDGVDYLVSEGDSLLQGKLYIEPSNCLFYYEFKV